jgi:hypothetical protein
MTREVHVVVPAGIDDLASPSGGNHYDRRVVQGLAATGWDVRERAVPGGWPRPDTTARAGLATALAACRRRGRARRRWPAGSRTSSSPRRPAALSFVHLPLGDETGRLGSCGAGGVLAAPRRDRHRRRAGSSPSTG